MRRLLLKFYEALYTVPLSTLARTQHDHRVKGQSTPYRLGHVANHIACSDNSIVTCSIFLPGPYPELCQGLA